MVSDAHRAEIAAVPQEVLHRIMQLPDPTFEAVNDALDDEHQYLAPEILTLLTEPQEPAAAERVDDAEPAGRDPALSGRHHAQETPVAEDPPAPRQAPQAQAGAPNRAAAFLDELTEEDDRSPSGFNPADLLPGELVQRFSSYEYGAVEDRVAHLRAAHRPAQDDRGEIVELNWDHYTEPGTTHTVYRVVATTNIGRPANPEDNDQLALTVGTAYEDDVRPNEAFREYQVWAYAGQSANDCFRRQPVLLGRKLVIFPVRGLSVSASDGKISGTWESLPGHHRMRVYITDAKSGLAPDSPGAELETGVSDRDFRYSSPVQGITLNVAVKPEILHPDGRTELGPISRVVSQTLDGNLVKTNFASVERMDTNEGTLIWFSVYGPPAGNFRVYLTQQKPDKDLSWNAQDLSALPQGGLDGTFHDYGEIPHNEQFDRDHLWPDGWDSVFVTPVTVLGDSAWVGDTVALQRVQEVTEPELREYGGYQLVTFAWPRGASMVKVERQYQDSTERTMVRDFSEEDYSRDGGIRLNLDPGGEEVVLTPQNSYAGKTTTGPETVLPYPGLKRFYYDVRVQSPTSAGPGGLQVAVWADGQDDLNPPSFTALLNPDRLPLSPSDLYQRGVQLRAGSGEQARETDLGINLTTERISAEPAQAARWFIPASEFPAAGYFRLFLQQLNSHEDGAVRKILTDERTTLRRISDADLRVMTEVHIPQQAEPVVDDTPEAGFRSWFRRG